VHHTQHRILLRRTLFILLLVLLAFSITPRALQAQAIIRGDRVYSGEVIDNDVIMSGDDVRLAGTVRGNAFITGRTVTVDGDIEGSLFVIGQRVTINGAVVGSAYVTAVSARLGSTGAIGQNLYFLGVSLATDPTSQIGRDLNGLSLGAYLQGSVGRETQLIAGLVQFLGMFMDLALGPAPTPLQVAALSGRPPGFGQITLPGNVYIDLIGQAIDPAQAEPATVNQSALVGQWFLDQLIELLPLLIVGLIAYWFLRRPLDAAAGAIRSRPLPALGIGLVGLVLSASIIGAFILVFLLILMLGIWLGTISLWNVSWLFWSVAFPLASLVFSLFMIFLNHGTKVIVAYAVMTYAVNRFAPQAGRYRWVWFILGLVIFTLLRAIPILGWIISVLVTAWGIGAAWLAWRGRRHLIPVDAESVPEPAEVSIGESPLTTKSGE
jgi:hypothetical protein